MTAIPSHHSITQSTSSSSSSTSGQQPMSAFMVVLGLVNGMLGGTCMVLPLLGLKTGYITTLLVCAFTGFIGYYTAYLIVLHLGQSKNIKQCILTHFDQDYRYMRAYSFFIWLSFVSFLLIYFRIICLQIQALIGYESQYVAPLVGVGLTLAIIFIRVKGWGEETLAYGVISIVGYLVFIVWAQVTAPSGPKQVIKVGSPIDLTSTLMMAFSVHGFLAANIVRNPNRSQYHGIVKWTFISGTLSYLFITYACFAIVNRKPVKQHPQLINDYFQVGNIQNSVIQVVYMIHMLSAYPNFLLISKQRFFQIFNLKAHHNLNWRQLLYILIWVLIPLMIYQLNTGLQTMIDLNGAIIGFAYVILIPIGIHLKCVFINRNSGYIEDDHKWNQAIKSNQCQCNNTYRSKWTLYAQTAFLVFIIVMGIALIVFTMEKVSRGRVTIKNQTELHP